MSNSRNFIGKVAIVTGSSSGIGAATAIHFAQFGGQVVITGRNEEKLQKVFDECIKAAQGNFGTKVIQLIGDVTDLEFCKKLIKTTIETFGKIDILVNNAGLAIQSSIYDKKLLTNYDKMMDINLKSIVVLTQLAVPYLEQTKGVIVNMSSVRSAKPSPSFSFYCMVGAALDMFTKCLALEVGPKGIRVNSVNPGPVRTNFFLEGPKFSVEQRDNFYDEVEKEISLRRIGKTDEIAKHIAFLASDDSSFITGTHLLDDGAYLWSVTNF